MSRDGINYESELQYLKELDAKKATVPNPLQELADD